MTILLTTTSHTHHPPTQSDLVVEYSADVLDDGRDLHYGFPTGLKLGGDSEAAADVCADFDGHVVRFRGGREDTNTASKTSLQRLEVCPVNHRP